MSSNTHEHVSLSRAVIAAKALQIADREGIENLSMRKLAGELGKTAMALYRYFDSMEDIQASALALAFEEVDTASIPGERWDDTMRRVTASIRSMYLRHLNANLGCIPASGDSPALRAHTEKVYTLHANQGIPAHILDKAWRITDAFLTGFIFSETMELQAVRQGSSDNSPCWTNAVTSAYSDEAFHDGIEIILSGIAALAAPDSADWRTPV